MKNETCPKCKSKNIKNGVMFAAVAKVLMYSPDNLGSKASPISAEYCNDCGYILAFYVDEPKSLN